VATLTRTVPQSWVFRHDGEVQPAGRRVLIAEPFRYVQVWRPGPDPDAGPVFQLSEPYPDEALKQLRQNPVARVKEYADAVLDRMVAQGQLPEDFRDRAWLMPRAEFHEQIARAFSAHLATTPELRYTTSLRRERKNIDPIEDFLYHSRAGHCERFATALALMLRSQDIPATVVLGFKGCEPTDSPGRYIVRHEHAHAWVQALVPVPIRPLGVRLRQGDWCQWLSLDPTPTSTSDAGAEGDGTWAEQMVWWLRTWFHDYFINYTPDQREDALAAVAGLLTHPGVLATAAVLAAGVPLVGWLGRRRHRAVTLSTPQRRWFDRLLAVLAAHGFRPAPGQTPREFAAEVGESLRRVERTSRVAEVPLDWAEAYYETRFGGTALPPDRLAALDAGLRNLERALPA
jgi:protein-glutamine gamma-glutamyltransferase